MLVYITQYNIGVDGNPLRPWDGAKGGYSFVEFLKDETDDKPMLRSRARLDYRCKAEDWVSTEHCISFRLELVYG